MKQPKVIKRYANRKLYDTERSCYVTLEEISQMIKDGEEVSVIDNKTKDDLTAVTLAQIIVEEEKKVAKMPLKLLRSIIQSGTDALGDLYQKRVADPVINLREDVERRVGSLLSKGRKEDEKHGQEGHEGAGDAPAHDEGAAATATTEGADGEPEKAGIVHEFVASTTEAFESWQRHIDARVRDAFAKMNMAPKVPPDVDVLRGRIEQLEARVKDVEARRKSL